MDTFVYFIAVLCVFNGYDCYSTSTLILAEQPCKEMNINSSMEVYEPVSYDETHAIEDDILKLLSNGDYLRLSDHGEILQLNTLGCYRLNEQSENKIRLFEVKGMLKLISTKQHLQFCIENESPVYGIVATSTSCACVPLNFFDIIDEVLLPTDPTNCMKYGSENNSNKTGDMYMFVSNQPYQSSSWFYKFMSSCRVLSSYIVNTERHNQQYSDYYSRYGLQTNGDLCYTRYYINDTEHCTSLVDYRIQIEDTELGNLKVCQSTKQSNGECIYNMDIKRYIPSWRNNYAIYERVYREMGSQTVYSVYYRETINLLSIFDKTVTTRCIKLLREVNRLFVSHVYCSQPMKHLCKMYAIERSTNGTTLHITLATVGCCVFILLVATLVRVIIVRKRRHQNTGSHPSVTQDRNSATEIHHIGSIRGGRVIGQTQREGVVPGRMGMNRQSTVSQLTTDGQDAGAVPGRMGMNRQSTVSQLTNHGQVPGRINGVYNPDYFRSETQI